MVIWREASGYLVPEQIVGRFRQEGKRHKPVENRGKFTVGRPFLQRLKEIHSRESFGQGELDAVVSGGEKSKGCVATFIEWKTRLYNAIPMLDAIARSMKIVFGAVASSYPVGALQIATTD